MNRRSLLASLVACPLLAARSTFARPPAARHRLGVLLGNKAQASGLLGVLAGLGYVEGRNLLVEGRYIDDYSLASRAAAELVRLEVDVLLTVGTPATRVLRRATSTIPIVTHVADPVAGAFTRSLAKPSDNVTGLALDHPDSPAKQVELLRAVMPRLDRLAIIGNAGNPDAREIARHIEAAARSAGIAPEVQLLDRARFDRAFGEMKGRGLRAAFLFLAQFPQIGAEVARLAIGHGMATMATRADYVERGGLMSFGMRHQAQEARSALIIDKLFRGLKPADIPWELPDRSHFAINLRTAKALGLTVPTDLLLRADQVIE